MRTGQVDSLALIRLDAPRYSELTAALAAIQNALQLWPGRGQTFDLANIPGFGNLNPVTLIRRALSQCPDESPAPQVTGLAFIADGDLRQNLRIDISEAYRAYADSSWKAATVLAGSVLEALLLWAVQQKPDPQVVNAVNALVNNRSLGRNPSPNPESWVLAEYIEVARQLGIITPNTATQCNLTRDFRNLIHPGRAQRLGLTCDKAMALSALASVEHVVRELTP